MPDTAFQSELPILDEIGAALHAASVAADQRQGQRQLLRSLSRGRWLRRPITVAIVVIGGSMSLGGLALAGTFNGGTVSPQAWVDGQRVHPEAAATPDQTSLAILRRPRVASDALPPYYVNLFENSPAAANGVNASLSRRAQGFGSGSAWVIPGNDGTLCLVADNAQELTRDLEPTQQLQLQPVSGAMNDTACGPASTVNTGWSGAGNYVYYSSAALGANTPASYFTGGIVPDGVTEVNVGVAGGATVSLPVHDNVYIGALPGVPDSLSFSGPNGQVTRSWS